jgi:hypothetical protein
MQPPEVSGYEALVNLAVQFLKNDLSCRGMTAVNEITEYLQVGANHLNRSIPCVALLDSDGVAASLEGTGAVFRCRAHRA